MRRASHLVASLLPLALAACGGSSTPPLPDISVGSGTGTLVVRASVDSSSRVANSPTAGQYTTDVTVNVWRVAVSGSRVAAVDAQPRVVIDGNVVPLVADPQVAGQWSTSLPGVPGDHVTLDVAAGNDSLGGVVRRAPGLHTFTSPAGAGANVSVSAAYTAKWSRPVQSDRATLEMGKYQGVVGDTGDYTLAPYSMGNLTQPSPGEPCTLERRNEVNVAGGAPGFDSWLRITVHQDLGGITLVP